MAFRLSRIEAENKQDLINTLTAKQEAFETAQVEFHQGRVTSGELAEHLAHLIVAISDAETFRDEVATRLREEFDEKSERWQESETGASVGEMIDQWESAAFDEPDLEDPQDLEVEDYSANLEDLPNEP